MGLPPRSCATDAYHCIMVEVPAGPAEYKCVARLRVHHGELPSDREIRLDRTSPIQACPGLDPGWGIPGRRPAPTSPSRALRRGPLPLPPKGRRGELAVPLVNAIALARTGRTGK